MPKRTSRNAQGAGSIRQRPDGRWEARYTMGRDPGTGKQIQRSVYGDTQGEVLKKLKLIQAEAEQGNYVEPSKMTVGEWLDIWAAEYLGGTKDATEYAYKAKIRNHIKPALGAVKLQKLNPHNVQSFYNDLQRVKNLSPKSIKNVHGVLHIALKQAVKLGYLRSNPADGATLPRIERPDISTLPEDILPDFLEALNTHEYGDIYYTTLFTGMRQSEVLGLTWDCVDFNKGIIVIRRQLIKQRQSGKYELTPLKNDKPRTITPAASVMDRLKTRRVKQLEDQIRAGQAWDNPLGLVFTDELGNHLVHITVYKNYKRIVEQLGLPSLRFHDLRHTYAVNALQSGDDIKTVQDNLGHHTAAFTLDTYGHVTEKMKQDSADRMEQYIQSITKKSRPG